MAVGDSQYNVPNAGATVSGIGNVEFLGDDLYFGTTTPINGSQYPPAHSTVYVKATTVFSANYVAHFATNPAISLVGTITNQSWLGSATTNQRFHIDLGEKKVIDKIYYENLHNSGSNTTNGVKDFTLWGTNDYASFLETTYAVDTGWTQIATSQSTFDQHVAANTVDPKYITATNTAGYRYVGFKFATNWGGGTYMGLRRIELQANNIYRKNIVLTNGANLTSGKMSVATTNGRLIDSVLYANTVGVGNIATPLYGLDFTGTSRLGSTLYLNHENVGTGSNIAIAMYGSGAYRNALVYDGTTGKVQYVGAGGTQGLELVTLNRSVLLQMLSSDANYGLTATTTDPNSASQNHLSINARFNCTGTYDVQNIRLLDSSSNAESNYIAFYSSATYGGVQTMKFRIRKDSTQFNFGGHVENTTRTATTPYVVLATDYVVYVDSDGGAMAVTLPAGIDGTTYKIVNVGSSGNNVTITPNGAEKIRGAATLVLTDGLQAYITYETTEKWW
jgi:hypothetical protein